MALVINDRVKETSTTSGTGTLNLAGAVTGFVTFVAGIGDTNTTYYAIFEQGTANWEVGIGTVGDATPDTLARTTVISNSLGNTDKISFGGETADVFCTLPASKAQYLDGSDVPVPAQISFKEGGTDFTNSLLVGHSTSGTLSAATNNVGVGITALDALTSGDDNVAVGSAAGSAIADGLKNVCVGRQAGMLISSGESNIAIGYGAVDAVTSGNSNIGIGAYCLSAATGSGNTAVGQNSGNLITGDKNVCLGYLSGDNITSGSGNVAIGKADVPSATGDDQLSISDGEDGAVVWMTGDSDGTVSANGGELTTTGKAFVMGF